ncbi:MAG TPA: methylated-DNA--[protein]-cysteine S-methyltransferase [Candidatus Sulfopaludibacter sp.]|nr:methylated-DNA--[protein]-cysteine S-methyltransferase [Terriglobia bacterium]HEV2445823.1 methylated-DNA--[protein]-cysteine S-methyltransferase [Candidatus Sulfopaludibacter sp.]
MRREQIERGKNRLAGAPTYWQAVLARDGAFDGRFVYAVRSTGIYCRPSCPSRRPGRAQAEFYPSPEAAERAGFRACRRCRPRRQGSPDPSPQTELVKRVCREIDAALGGAEEFAGADGAFTLAALATRAGASPQHLQRSFQRVLGITPRGYLDARRLGRLKAQLKKGRDVAGALYEAGYGSSRGLYERAPSQLGMTPATYRKGGRGMDIRYTVVECPLGRLLVAATDRGICSVCLGDSGAALETVLRAEYPEARISRITRISRIRKSGGGSQSDSAPDGLGRWAPALVRHLEGKLPSLDLPVDVRATAFQWRVWRELQTIPYGSTRSYSEVARAMGQPAAVRAVARACATNPVAVVIPCHRVVRGDGSLGGYRWGLERKRMLLEREAGPPASEGTLVHSPRRR